MAASSTDFYRKAPPDRGASSFIYPPTEANLAFFSKALQAGCVVAIPTETVYGLAAIALNPEFCRSIFSIKGRPLMDPLIVHVDGFEMAKELAFIPSCFEKLSRVFWPGPLTLILKKRPCVPDLVTAGKETVAVRMPRHSVVQQLIGKLKMPLAAPSANPFGYVSPSRPEHVAHSFGEKVPFIIDGGPCEIGLESTILDISKETSPAVLRPGAITIEQIEAVLDTKVTDQVVQTERDQPATAPGTMASHYSPHSRLVAFKGEPVCPSPEDAVVYLKRPTSENAAQDNTFWFSESGDAPDVARSLFDLLRNLDREGFKTIHCESPDAEKNGLFHAIRDRISRAAAND